MIGEVGKVGQPHEDLAGHADRKLAPGTVEDADDRLVDRPADGAGTGEEIGARREGHGAAFGGAVELVEHRTPPVDHRALDLDRAGRRGMDDEAQR